MKNNKIIDREEKYWENKEEFDWLTERSILSILQKIPEPSGSSLELCAGSGMFTKHMNFKKSNKYVCLDISQSLLKKLKKTIPKIEIKKGDAQKLPYKKNTFDSVYIYAGLHHLPEMELCLKDSYKVLKKKGKFICFEPNRDCFYRDLMLKLRTILGLYTEDEIFIHPKELIIKLKKEGFKNIQTIYVTPTYKLQHIKLLFPLFLGMKIISLLPGRYFQSFFIIICEK